MRVVLTNRWASQPLHIGRAVVRAGGRTAPLTFRGEGSTSIPEGRDLTSDPVDMPLLAGTPIDVDLHLPGPTDLVTGNISVSTWRQSVAGDHCGAAAFPADGAPVLTLPDGTSVPAPTPVLRSVEIYRGSDVSVVVCLGDSITAAGWPERSAQRLDGSRVAVVNRGIAGNRLRLDGAGPFGGFFGTAGVKRFDYDVLATAGRTHVVIALGTNDLGHPGGVAPSAELPAAAELISELDATSSRARSAGLGVFLATITPFLPADGYDAQRDATRSVVNEWIRDQHPRAAVIDFDTALRSDDVPTRLDPQYDSGDHLHPNDAGVDRMADAAAAAIATELGLPCPS